MTLRGGESYRKARPASDARSSHSSKVFLKPRGSRGGKSHTNPTYSPNDEVIYFSNIAYGSAKAAEDIVARFPIVAYFVWQKSMIKCRVVNTFTPNLRGFTM